MDAINELRCINTKAMKTRYYLTPIEHFDYNLPSTSTAIDNVNNCLSKKLNFNDWSAAAVIINKSRKILDETVVLLPKVLESVKSLDCRKNVVISDSEFVRSNNLLGLPIYDKLYQHLGAIVSTRSISKMTRLFK